MSRIFEATTVRYRHFALPLDEYQRLSTFQESNDQHLACAVRYGTQAVDAALRAAGVRPDQVDMLITHSATGISLPPFDVGIIDRVGLRRDVKRMPLFGFGCGGGGAALARLHDYLRAWPDHTAVLVSVDLPSLVLNRTLFEQPLTAEFLLGLGLFGDAAAAMVARGSDTAVGPRIRASRSYLVPASTHIVGFDIGHRGFSLRLHRDLPEHATRDIGDKVYEFLAEHDLTVRDIATWICHPGGPEILDRVVKEIGLPDDALDLSYAHLTERGNCSAASVLCILADAMKTRPPSGSPAIVISIGPGLFHELVLLHWL